MQFVHINDLKSWITKHYVSLERVMKDFLFLFQNTMFHLRQNHEGANIYVYSIIMERKYVTIPNTQKNNDTSEY